MSLTKKITSNTIIHTAGKFTGSAIGVIVLGFLARYLGTQGFGYYTTIFAYLFFFSVLGDLGLYLITINELGRAGVDTKKIFSNTFTIRFVSGLFLMLLACSLIWFFPYPLLVKLGTLIIAICVFIMMLDQLIVALFQKEMKTQVVAISEIVGKLIYLALVILVIKMDAGFLAILWATVIGFLIHFLINFIFARKLLAFKFAFDKEIWKNILKKSWPIATYMIFSMIYFKADTIILSLYHPAETVGLYGAPYKILEVLIVFPAIFMGLVSPHLSNAFSKNNIEDFKRIFQKAFDGLSLIVWPIIFGTLALASSIIYLIAGKEFLASIPILQILIVATGIIFLAHLSTFAVVAINKQKSMMKYYIFAAALALALYFIFIPKYSFYAAAIITAVIEFFILISSWLMIKKTLKFKTNFSICLKSLLASVVMFIFLYFSNFNLLISVILGGFIYLVLIYLFGALKKEMVISFLKK
ncbi:flippase [Patescibacteria group bacterium]|nr:flippase [Patescibacteria group bacterium]